MKTPQVVKDAAKYLTDMFPATYYHIGEYEGYEVYTLNFKEPVIIGFPEVYLYKEGEEVISIRDEELPFHIMKVAARNTRERRKAARLAKQGTT